MSQTNPFVRPTHTLDLHQPGAVEQLLTFHRQAFGGWRMGPDPEEAGGTGGGGSGDGTGAGTGPQGAGTPSTGGGTGGDTGYPANTPVEQMTAPQREAYYRAENAKWKGRAETNYASLRSLGVTKADDVAAVKDKITRHDALEHELKSDKDKAVADAETKTKSDSDAHYRPLLVQAEFKAAAAGRIAADALKTILEPLDLSKFLTDSGEVDATKVAKYVDGVAPSRGTGARAPIVQQHGDGAGSKSGSGSTLTGRELYDQRHPKKTAQA